ncbi:hypothetical protein [Streptomyces sp. NPDC091294]|uniref:hypothetical protein n=1 Tax=Streptomyces sp. NPDC091294 TaxID=3365992 RepID=UPI0037FD9300
MAVIVSAASATFTGANMLITALNYRRDKPRVRVSLAGQGPAYRTLTKAEIKSRHWWGNGPDVDKVWAEPCFEVLIENLSKTSVRVIGVESSVTSSPLDHAWRALCAEERSDTSNSVTDCKRPTFELAPLQSVIFVGYTTGIGSGHDWKFSEKQGSLHVRARVKLENGRTIEGKGKEWRYAKLTQIGTTKPHPSTNYGILQDLTEGVERFNVYAGNSREESSVRDIIGAASLKAQARELEKLQNKLEKVGRRAIRKERIRRKFARLDRPTD